MEYFDNPEAWHSPEMFGHGWRLERHPDPDAVRIVSMVSREHGPAAAEIHMDQVPAMVSGVRIQAGPHVAFAEFKQEDRPYSFATPGMAGENSKYYPDRDLDEERHEGPFRFSLEGVKSDAVVGCGLPAGTGYRTAVITYESGGGGTMPERPKFYWMRNGVLTEHSAAELKKQFGQKADVTISTGLPRFEVDRVIFRQAEPCAIDVTVKDEAGTPMVGIPVRFVRQGWSLIVPTDAHGLATYTTTDADRYSAFDQSGGPLHVSLHKRTLTDEGYPEGMEVGAVVAVGECKVRGEINKTLAIDFVLITEEDGGNGNGGDGNGDDGNGNGDDGNGNGDDGNGNGDEIPDDLLETMQVILQATRQLILDGAQTIQWLEELNTRLQAFEAKLDEISDKVDIDPEDQLYGAVCSIEAKLGSILEELEAINADSG